MRTTIEYRPEATVLGTVMSARVFEPEQSKVPSVATYRTAFEGPLTRSTLTALESLPIEAQLPVQPTKLGTSVFQTVPSVGLLICSISAETVATKAAAETTIAEMNFIMICVRERV